MLMKCLLCNVVKLAGNRIVFDVALPNPTAQFGKVRFAQL